MTWLSKDSPALTPLCMQHPLIQVVGAILVVNKMQTGSERDIFFDNYFGEVGGQHHKTACMHCCILCPCHSHVDLVLTLLPVPHTLWPQADVEAMALFALEVGHTLGDRSLECALASAMSVINMDCTPASGVCTFRPCRCRLPSLPACNLT